MRARQDHPRQIHTKLRAATSCDCAHTTVASMAKQRASSPFTCASPSARCGNSKGTWDVC
eukprot:225674-Pelagomonas_calceolata.AAC.5